QGVKKTDIGKEAILRAAAALTAQDEFGVVAFDSSAHWVVQTAPLGGVTDLQSQLNAITPDGTTNIFAGLDQAVESLKNAKATRRHIILLTDGWSSSGQYDQIIADMKDAGITLSAVGAGGGANEVQLLRKLAQQGGGRYYDAVNPSSIPDIFLKETQQVSGQQIVEEQFFPILTSSSPILRGIEGGFPSLLGYNGTTAKAAAQTVLVTARDDPLLAQWQYGLGRSVAWTSDSTGRWAKSWIGWNGFSTFFSQMVGWTFPGEESGGIEASFEDRGGRTYLRVESVEDDGSARDFYRTQVALIGPDLAPANVDLSQVAPGVYEAPLASLDSGAYAVRVTQTKAGSPSLGRTLGLVAPTAAEYRLLGANEPLLAAMRDATGGRALEAPADAWVHDLQATSRFTELWPWLLVLALLLWPLDVALRRVSLGRRELADGRRWVGDRVRGRRVARRSEQTEDLFAARGRAGAAGARAALMREASAAPAHGVTPVPPASSAGPGPAQASATEPSPSPAPVSPVAPVAPDPSRAPAPPSQPAPSAAASTAPPPPPVVSKAVAPPAPPTAAPPSVTDGSSRDDQDTLSRLREAKRRTRG
ncbi:MAG TPA: VWA domain-containing protein, partial [Candidatus Limnocylindrales bacterium]|nr:VWA domain-containing protein [Candidatus Limnocylindrales bacterium]